MSYAQREGSGVDGLPSVLSPGLDTVPAEAVVLDPQ
jgi:hypothetical protein